MSDQYAVIRSLLEQQPTSVETSLQQAKNMMAALDVLIHDLDTSTVLRERQLTTLYRDALQGIRDVFTPLLQSVDVDRERQTTLLMEIREQLNPVTLLASWISLLERIDGYLAVVAENAALERDVLQRLQATLR